MKSYIEHNNNSTVTIRFIQTDFMETVFGALFGLCFLLLLLVLTINGILILKTKLLKRRTVAGEQDIININSNIVTFQMIEIQQLMMQ